MNDPTGHKVHWNPGDPAEPDELPRHPDDLDLAVQALVDHDRENARRSLHRSTLRSRIVDLVKQRGYYPNVDSDPIEFRCGDIVVRVGSELDVSYRIITQLYVRTEEW